MTPVMDHAAVAAARGQFGSGWPSNCATNRLATSGWRWRIITKQSSQLAQWAESRKREALLRPSPPRTKGKLAISLPSSAVSHFNNSQRHCQILSSWARAYASTPSGVTKRI